jgi:hypothetical protein
MSARVDSAAKRRPRSFGVSDADSALIDSLADRLGCSRSEVVVRAVRLLTLRLGTDND